MFSNPLLFTMVSDLQEGAGDQGAVGAEPSMEIPSGRSVIFGQQSDSLRVSIKLEE